MLSFEKEIEALRPQLGDARADALIARERREIFSIHPELRICGWLGATLLASAAGVFLKNNLQRIGPTALAVMIGIAAAACYAWTWWRRSRATLIDDYILLLGALLVSADVAFIESQWHFFGPEWKRHLLIIAVFHALGAYAYGSRVLLSLSIAALASWLGVDRRAGRPEDLAMPSYILAAILLGWRIVDARLHGPAFSRTLEHFAANAALFGGIALLFDYYKVTTAGLLTIAIAAVVIFWGVRTRHEPFVLYAFVYAVIAADALLIHHLSTAKQATFAAVVSIIIAIALLLTVHKRFQEQP